MNENKGQTIFLSVIGIATLLVAIIGATFAFFTTQMTGEAADVSATAAKIGSIGFTAQGVGATEILPGWTSGAKTVEVTYGAADYPIDYTCTLNVTSNGFTDMALAVSGDNAVPAANKTLTAEDTAVTIASGTIQASASQQTKTMTYTLTFPETGENQNAQQTKNITATVSCSTNGQVFYNTTNPSGTNTQPTA